METFYKQKMPPIEKFSAHKKKVTTMAYRVNGPFEVLTSEGLLHCKDGWLCIDARGYPYPVAADEFALIYEAVD